MKWLIRKRVVLALLLSGGLLLAGAPPQAVDPLVQLVDQLLGAVE